MHALIIEKKTCYKEGPLFVGLEFSLCVNNNISCGLHVEVLRCDCNSVLWLRRFNWFLFHACDLFLYNVYIYTINKSRCGFATNFSADFLVGITTGVTEDENVENDGVPTDLILIPQDNIPIPQDVPTLENEPMPDVPTPENIPAQEDAPTSNVSAPDDVVTQKRFIP